MKETEITDNYNFDYIIDYLNDKLYDLETCRCRDDQGYEDETWKMWTKKIDAVEYVRSMVREDKRNYTRDA